jgi:hypothetical protein
VAAHFIAAGPRFFVACRPNQRFARVQNGIKTDEIAVVLNR